MSEENKEEPKPEIKTIKCKNCFKEIEETKFFLHEGFCLRNNVLCSICKEPITKEDLESHMQEHKEEKEEKEREEKERAKKIIEEKKKKLEESNKIITKENNNTVKPKNTNNINNNTHNKDLKNTKTNSNKKPVPKKKYKY